MSAEPTIPTNSDGLTFKAWYAKADTACLGICGLGIEDLPDGNSYDAWASDSTPREYAVMLLEEEGFPFP